MFAERRAGTSGEERDEDDDEAGDEGGFCGGGAGEAGGLELISGCEEEADDQAGDEGVTVDLAELAVVHDDESEEREGHAEEVEEEWGDVLEGVFDEDEGGSPDEDDRQEQNVGECRGAESLRQLSLVPWLWRVSLRVRCRRFRR